MAVLWECDCQKIQQRNTSSSYLEKQNPRLDIFCFVFQNVVCFIWQKNRPGKADTNGFTPSGSHGISDGTETNLRTILLIHWSVKILVMQLAEHWGQFRRFDLSRLYN